ncbi:MAG: DUF4197 domain-containing protein [Planctomycetaceae bacterium]|nr:DUF4197 domain-containing protein [Planctomycetaceae bacterium]
MRTTVPIIVAAVAALLTGGCNSDFDSMLGAMGMPLDDNTIARGLGEALKVGTENAVAKTSTPGGYFSSALLKITVPSQFDKAAATLRKVGLGGQVDAFERQMNAAAEHAATQAGPVFIDAIKEMSFDDARLILTGGSKTAATDYFRQRTSARLKSLYMPIVSDQMGRLGVVKGWNDLVGRYNAIPLSAKPQLPGIEDYVTSRALEGLFKVVAQEEQSIREDPAARTTALLKRVFAQQ